MNPCNGMVSPPVPKTPGNHGRYRHIHLGAYVLAHHVSFPIRLMRIAHSHDVLDSSLHSPDYHGLCTAYDHSPSHPMVAHRLSRLLVGTCCMILYHQPKPYVMRMLHYDDP